MPPWSPIPRPEIVRKLWIAAAFGAGALVLSAVVIGIVAGDEWRANPWRPIGWIVTITLFIGGLAISAVSWTWRDRIELPLRGDWRRAKAIKRAVAGRSHDELDAAGRRAAAQYAQSGALLNITSSAGALMVTLGVGLNSFNNGVARDAFSMLLGIVVLVALVVVIGFLVRDVRRMRRYAREHADDLTLDDPQPALP